MHHVSLQVSNIERAINFYCQALDGHVLMHPVLVEGRVAEHVMDGPAGTRFHVALIALGGGGVELLSFLGAVAPRWVRPGQQRRVPHVAVQVDDVERATQRVMRSGGTRLLEHGALWGAASSMFVSDPDGNVIELIDAPLETLAEEARRLYPEAVV